MTQSETLTAPSTPQSNHRPRLRVLVLGMLLLQVVWIFAVPPFRGIDEFDHTYRAAAVARGQWVAPPADATRGTGAWLQVPQDIVRAATPECSKLEYTTEADCVGRTQDGRFEAASGAGRYEPVYYAVIGTVALPFDGNAALYTMRVTAAALCLLMFVLALRVTQRWASTPWPTRAVVIAATPVLVYSTVVPGPNGLEMMSGLTLWTACIGLAVGSGQCDRTFLLAVALSGTLLAGLRQLGPLWVLLIAFTVLLAVPVGRARLRSILLRPQGWMAAAVVLAATVGNVMWTSAMSSLNLGTRLTDEPISTLEATSIIAWQTPLWVLQSIAAFPLRNENTHPAVYVSFLVLGGWLLVSGMRRAGKRLRSGIAFAIVAALVVPALISYATLDEFGTVWQGRYTIPFSIGVLLLLGLSLERSGRSLRGDVAVGGGVLFVLGQLLGPMTVALQERDVSPGVANGAWVMVPVAALVVLAVLGAALLWGETFRDTFGNMRGRRDR